MIAAGTLPTLADYGAEQSTDARGQGNHVAHLPVCQSDRTLTPVGIFRNDRRELSMYAPVHTDASCSGHRAHDGRFA